MRVICWGKQHLLLTYLNMLSSVAFLVQRNVLNPLRGPKLGILFVSGLYRVAL